jgi:hypothetical protein
VTLFDAATGSAITIEYPSLRLCPSGGFGLIGFEGIAVAAA